MAQCPFVETPENISTALNTPINFKELGGSEDYVFYDHDDGFGVITRVQFCQLIGRKRDVFECLNESEWQCCDYYRTHTERRE